MAFVNVKSRWSAFAIHLVISLVILLILLAIIFFYWFPHDLIYAGGIDGLKILGGVDLIIGPLLTLLVFVPGKKGLKFDLTLIGLFQITCLCIGLWLIYNQRPLAQIVIDDGVHLLSASEFKAYDTDVSNIAGRTPKKIMMDIPEDLSQLSGLKFTSEFVEEKPFPFRADLYIPFSEVNEERFSQRIDFIQKQMEEKQLENLSKRNEKSCRWIPLISTHNEGFACMNYKQGIIKLSNHQLL